MNRHNQGSSPQCSPQHLDEMTVARARRGNQDAMAEVIRHFSTPVYALVSRMLVGRPEQVEDVAQDALVKILRALPRFDPQGPAKLSSWVLTIATRVGIDAIRRQRNAEALDEDLPDPFRGSLEQHLEQRDLTRRVTEAMAALPWDHRTVLVLRAYHDFDYAEIALALNIEEGTVKSRLARAREALRGCLAHKEVVA